uniref:Si:ch211-214c7.5 n=1 Tax=Kryptolebias marmoratus TaxID=37003 RepID=A0A3Q3EFB1_KRYMA
QGHVEREALAAAISSLLYTCQPYFNHLESTARSTMLLDFSQQLCDKLEQLVLTYASYGLLSLNEAEPDSASHFCVGQTQLGQLKLTIFRYCQPTPYLSRANTQLYKRMRWNVERVRDQQQTEEEDGDDEEETYFLCYEDIPNPHAEANEDSEGVSDGSVVRMWSIGQWVQANPDPSTEDIWDWILCEVPQGGYNRLLFLGHDEPSSRSATDYLQQLLLSYEVKGTFLCLDRCKGGGKC